ncbi:XrtA/PEP-CTERM system exopolysaccharide export protein [Spartinivicinus poritis]|uniref:Polysaccharide export protein n=1 Tax=Spartinivicinus poritis TaxID=2994640 RepID=A0ABT5UE01_9GAMM|nr:XrtA/PEP-CTERM system exopolysaccharide export protein [Spartinivicinus sp. A2-2]MDE1464599.1 polysaccharide export protein [Spartinivicinus sp. A2-2]
MIKDVKKAAFFLSILTLAAGCANNEYPPLGATTTKQPLTTNPSNYNYRIGPGDQLQVFVWRNPELSTNVSVRPDGKVTSPLIEDISVSGKTATEVARAFEKELAKYIRDPIVTVLVEGFTGPYSEQVRIVGEASQPQAIAYREDMTLLDVMIAVGGLTEFAAGNKATLVRVEDGGQKQYSIRLEDLIEGDISANGDVLPGDVIIVPEAIF